MRFDEAVFAIDLFPPGMMCKLDCLWLSLYLYVSLAGSSRFSPIYGYTAENREELIWHCV